MCLKKKRNAVWMMYARIKHKKEKEKKEVYVGINKSYTCHNQSFICISYKKKVLYAYDMKKKKKKSYVGTISYQHVYLSISHKK